MHPLALQRKTWIPSKVYRECELLWRLVKQHHTYGTTWTRPISHHIVKCNPDWVAYQDTSSSWGHGWTLAGLVLLPLRLLGAAWTRCCLQDKKDAEPRGRCQHAHQLARIRSSHHQLGGSHTHPPGTRASAPLVPTNDSPLWRQYDCQPSGKEGHSPL